MKVRYRTQSLKVVNVSTISSDGFVSSISYTLNTVQIILC